MMATRPTSIASSTPYTYQITGQDDIGSDGPALRTLIASVRAAGGGTIWARGTFHIDADCHFLGDWDSAEFVPVSLVGWPGDEPVFKLASGAQLYWESSYNLATDPTWTPIQGIGKNYFESTGGVLAPVPGQVIVTKSDDVITGAPPHDTGWTMLSLESQLHVDTSGNRLWMDHTIEDTYTTNPMAAIMPTVQNVRIADITIVEAGGYTDTYGVVLSNLRGARIENVKVGNESLMGPGGIYFKNCVDTLIQGCDWTRNQNYAGSNGYGLVFGMALNTRCVNNKIAVTRHPVTTGNTTFSGGGTERRGTSKGLLIDSNEITFVPRQGGLSCIDSHQEGVYVTYSNNTVYLTSNEQAIAMNCRSRKMIVDGNRFIAGVGGGSRGGYLAADDIQLTNNTFQNFWYGPATASFQGYLPQRLRASGNRYINHELEGLRLTVGSGHRVSGEVFINCGYNPGTTARSCCIYVSGADDTIVEGCQMSKDSNAESINTIAQSSGYEVRGNNLQGYGSGDGGFGGSQGAAWQTAFGGQNQID